MKISYDETKRLKTIEERGLDFADAVYVFEGDTLEVLDERKDYGEHRILCFGDLNGRAVMVGYVQRGDVRHIFSMRKIHEKEKRKLRQRFQQN